MTMRVANVAFALTLTTLALLAFAVGSVFALKAVIVSDADGLGNYTPRNLTFTHGSTLKVYAEMKDVNHKGFVRVDFVFVIKDPKGYPVAMDKLEVRRRDYESDAYVLYTKKIPNWWLYGTYELDIYAYDRVDESKVRQIKEDFESKSITEIIESDEFDDYKGFFESGSDEDGIDIEKPLSDSKREHRTLFFSVVSEEELRRIERARVAPSPTPAKPRFVVMDVRTSAFEIQPGESVYVYVVVKNEGASGTDNISLFLNDKKYADATVTLKENATITVPFEVKLYEEGFYKITISGSNIVKGIYVKRKENSSSSATTSEGNSTVLASSTQKEQEWGKLGQSEEEQGQKKGKLPAPKGYDIVIAVLIALLAHYYRRHHR
ncbi:MAG: hypothetical protein OCU24_02785 [Candidatus Methanospirare jalkutatii]|nr:hypothetical protein [Candidatus Methanospirare jalkutatii]